MDSKPGRLPLPTTGSTSPSPMPTTPAIDNNLPPDSDAVLTAEQLARLREQVVLALRSCYDPEIPVNIYELGLIYQLDIASNGAVTVQMTLTSPACPVAGSLPGEVQQKVRAVPGVTGAKVDLVWDPPWDKDRMSDAAKLQLGLFD